MKLSDIHIRDPFILFDGGKYYLYGTRGHQSFGSCDGLDVYTSDDLVDWTGPTVAFTPPEDFWATRDFWAPEVHKYKGAYYIFASFKSEERCRGTQILKAESPMGPFVPHSDGPITPEDWECLDGTLYIDGGRPYMVFCHEWVQIGNGEICAIELSDDLKEAAGEPTVLFKASDCAGCQSFGGEGNYVTDGPFLYKTENGRLMMIWSSFSTNGYCEIISYSKDGSLLGAWIHDDRLLFEKDGGHGMIFRDKDGKLQFIAHAPNVSPNERPNLVELFEKDDTVFVK